MAGLSAAASAVRRGANVMLLECSGQLGGSALFSGGYFWTAPALDTFRAVNPLGDAALARVVTSGFDDAVSWVAETGIDVGPRLKGMFTFGEGHQFDIRGYLERCAAIVRGGGDVVLNADVKALLRRAGRVVGAKVHSGGTDFRVMASHTLLATGGFQADPGLRARHIHRNARGMLLRAAPHSRGGGLRLGLRAGGSHSTLMDGFYGHLVGSPVSTFGPSDYGPLAQYQSNFSLLVNLAGERFTDESGGDNFNAQAVLRQPERRAVLVVDERIRRDHLSVSHIQGLAWIDRFAAAARAGARYTEASTLPALAIQIALWGVNRQGFLRTVAHYNTGTLVADEPPRRRWYEPLLEPPYRALEVQPAITFTNGGLRVDATGRALTPAGNPIPGLLVAGADVGDVYQKAYAGGLVVALVLGRVAASTALDSA